ncbi:hypothetical protein Tco_1291752 [Tanacetum coccineum]
MEAAFRGFSVAAVVAPTRYADRAEDVGYVRALQASKRRMITSMKEVNLRVLEALNRALWRDLRHGDNMIRYGVAGQRAEDDAARQIMYTHVLEARAWIDTMEDTGSSC